MRVASLLLAPDESDDWLTVLAPELAKIDIQLHAGHHPQASIAVVTNPSAGLFQQLPHLVLIASLWAGVDRLVSDSSIAPQVAILRACDSQMRQSMTESALAHVLHAHLQHFRYREQQAQALWKPHEAKLAENTRVMVLGMGYLGGHVASAIQDLGFHVTGWSLGAARSVRAVHCIQGMANLKQALASTDILLNLLPDTPLTSGILNASLFAECRPGLCLINLARGKHLIENDLLLALAQGLVAHAALDVFVQEPLARDHAFWQHPRISITPHIAAPSHRQSVAASVSQDIALWLSGVTPASIVNRQHGY